MYNEKVLNEFFNPENVGVIKGATCKGKVVNPVDREIVKLYVVADGNKITEASFQAFGCTSTIACASVVTKMIINKTLDEVKAITAHDIEAELGGLPEGKKHSAKMAEDVIKNMVQNAEKQK